MVKRLARKGLTKDRQRLVGKGIVKRLVGKGLSKD